MSRRAQSMPAMIPEKPKRRPVVAFICFSWKVFTCVFSHVALVSIVVAYCIAGALIFEHLEAENEKTVKQGIRGMRSNVTDDLWDMTTTFDYLRQDNWTKWVENRLELFEREILTAMKTKGWDGNENEQQMQWTFFGALFYSIIVITTIELRPNILCLEHKRPALLKKIRLRNRKEIITEVGYNTHLPFGALLAACILDLFC